MQGYNEWVKKKFQIKNNTWPEKIFDIIELI